MITFPKDYPLNPPSMRFTSEVFHPNVYPDGRVCISILHPPGDDPNQYESRFASFIIMKIVLLYYETELFWAVSALSAGALCNLWKRSCCQW